MPTDARSAAHTASRKVVINACFGGFGLSPEGVIAYLARQGKTAHFYVPDRSSGDKPSDRDFLRVPAEGARDAFFEVVLTEDMGERVTHDTVWPDGQAHPAYFRDDDLKRDDPDLVAVVEELGEKASDSLANLEVVEIPADAAWEIAEYDGFEHVAEVHRTWR